MSLCSKINNLIVEFCCFFQVFFHTFSVQCGNRSNNHLIHFSTGCVESSESVFKGILTCIQNLVKISDLKSHGQGGDVESRGKLLHCFVYGKCLEYSENY